jgi:hypothetical protein
MWRKTGMGAETPFNKESPSLTQHADKQGSPWLAKGNISGAAVGILTKAVKRVLLLKNTDVTAV